MDRRKSAHRTRSEDQPISPAAQVPSLAINDFSLSLATTVPHISLPRIPLPNKTPSSSKNKIRRPSTASSVEERSARLPSSSNTSSPDHLTPSHTPGLDVGVDSLPMEKLSLEDMNRKAHAAMAGLRAEASRLSGAGEPLEILPSPFDPSPSEEGLSQTMSTRESIIDDHVDYDWATFINAYALGRWDPLRTPHPPRSHLQPPHLGGTGSRSVLPMTPEFESAGPAQTNPLNESPPDDSTDHLIPLSCEYTQPQSSSSQGAAVEYEGVERATVDPLVQSAPPQFHIPTSLTVPPAVPLSASTASVSSPTILSDVGISRLADRRTSVPLNLGPFSHRLRNSVADLRVSSSSTSTGASILSPPQASEVTTSAAAIRWAGARVSIAPLALPSPEHELTDPMRGVTATIPGSHPSQDNPMMFVRPEPITPISPNGQRKTRLSSFWQGTQDVEDKAQGSSVGSGSGSGSGFGVEGGDGQKKVDADASSSQTAPAKEKKQKHVKVLSPALSTTSSNSSSLPFVVGSSIIAPATAPVRYSTEPEDEDYFGFDGHDSSSATNGSNLDALRQSSGPPFSYDPATVPALPRRICLTRQASAPLPTVASYERRIRPGKGAVPVPVGGVSTAMSRAAKEEQMFNELGYLAPPNPPDELERRRALYKFNIWNTGHDSNFDRICHLVKLVFSTRIVMIALVDGTEVFLKSASGLPTSNLPRTSSFDAHALLQRDDEPTVVLDAHEDWRFAKNPLVIGSPHVRFYAACPLRTQDGFNIGTLTIMDDTPRREFNPRQRHTLKEFAQITMRELELWRDKIQLRIRDRIQTSMEEFTRECLEVDREQSPPSNHSGPQTPHAGKSSSPAPHTPQTPQQPPLASSMEQVYERAARLVKRTLDVEGAIVIDVSHVDIIETVTAESSTQITIHNSDPALGTSVKNLDSEEHGRLQEFFAKFPEGKISEGLVPASLRAFLPTRIQYALTGRPRAVYLRAIGVIILSAVLKRRMILADKAKSLFISNISHELRTPLHGILASAELLSETNLNHSQASFLQTVQACGTSLVETVNHVLDFTKVDLMQLVEEATEGCWIGHRARMFTSEIGSVYSPPKPPDRQGSSGTVNAKSSAGGASAGTTVGTGATVIPKMVETVVDIGYNPAGWTFRCEKGGIRRVLMNLLGNSLKFTTDGYVHVMLRQVSSSPDLSPKTVRIELTVADTGKTGTGLGLAIVNSIVRSSSVDGKVDVWSAEGVGTEIKITFTAEAIEDEDIYNNDAELVKLYNSLKRPSISLLGFDTPRRGVQLLKDTLVASLTTRWGFTLVGSELGPGTDGEVPEAPTAGDIVIVNEDCDPVVRAVQEKDTDRPFIILSSNRGDPRLMKAVADYERIGGFCRVAYKPVGPGRLFSVLKLCIHALNITESTSRKRSSSGSSSSSIVSRASGPVLSSQFDADGKMISPSSMLPRRLSEETTGPSSKGSSRPPLGPRSITVHPLSSWSHMESMQEQEEPAEMRADRNGAAETPVFSQSPSSPTIAVGTGGTLLKSVVGSAEDARGPLRVLVVEDNDILRNLLIKWLKNKGYAFRDAEDGLDGVRIFEAEGPFDVVLVDLSMPVLDGIGATTQMREIEAARQAALPDHSPARSRILALTGMSSLDDKRRAFDAGVDGYLVKPVAFKTLDSMFHKLGFSQLP
ncbi:His Kinase A domain containing protein [Steccherinum ochraceum]|uniref:histidine kinase n=1 Tax=Steccherinum ochraceum TaxID=92696 RepID=A0A4R0RJ47_9APHY|nr:His Kinase A domain containing protein [Steccherinum ochraceum]